MRNRILEGIVLVGLFWVVSATAETLLASESTVPSQTDPFEAAKLQAAIEAAEDNGDEEQDPFKAAALRHVHVEYENDPFRAARLQAEEVWAKSRRDTPSTGLADPNDPFHDAASRGGEIGVDTTLARRSSIQSDGVLVGREKNPQSTEMQQAWMREVAKQMSNLAKLCASLETEVDTLKGHNKVLVKALTEINRTNDDMQANAAIATEENEQLRKQLKEAQEALKVKEAEASTNLKQGKK